jgi:hypothetical protein
MTSFLKKASPALLKQLKGAKSNEEAFDLLAGAMAKLEDPAKRAALAQATLGKAELGPLFARGPQGIRELRDRYAELAGSQKEAAEKSGEVDDAFKDLKASTDGIKAALVVGLAPALKTVVERLRNWLVDHREDIKEWVVAFGEKLPGAIAKIASGIQRAVIAVREFAGEVVDLIDRVDKFFSDKGLEGASFEELRSSGGRANARARNELRGTEAMSPQERAARSQQLLREAAEITSGEHSQHDADIAEGKRRAAQALREGRTTMARPLTSAGAVMRAGMDNVSGLAQQREITAGVDKITSQAALLELLAQERAAEAKKSEAKVTIDITGAPRGTRVNADPKSTADVDLSVGYQLMPGMP